MLPQFNIDYRSSPSASQISLWSAPSTSALARLDTRSTSHESDYVTGATGSDNPIYRGVSSEALYRGLSHEALYRAGSLNKPLTTLDKTGWHIWLYIIYCTMAVYPSGETISLFIRDVQLVPKVCQMTSIGTNPGLFQIRFQYVLTRRVKMYEPKCTEIWSEKSRICTIWGRSDPLWAQMWHPRFSSSLIEWLRWVLFTLFCCQLRLWYKWRFSARVCSSAEKWWKNIYEKGSFL